MLPEKFAPVLFALIVTGLMSFIVSGISTIRAVGLAPEFFSAWVGAWLPSWMVAFPVILVVAPITQKMVARLVAPAEKD